MLAVSGGWLPRATASSSTWVLTRSTSASTPPASTRAECNTLRIGPMQDAAKTRQTRIETIRRCPPGTCVRVENEVITLHNSPRWDPQNRYIQHDSLSQEYRYKILRSKSP